MAILNIKIKLKQIRGRIIVIFKTFPFDPVTKYYKKKPEFLFNSDLVIVIEHLIFVFLNIVVFPRASGITNQTGFRTAVRGPRLEKNLSF